jgi:hypothetical protein
LVSVIRHLQNPFPALLTIFLFPSLASHTYNIS